MEAAVTAIFTSCLFLEQFGHELELYFTSLDWSSEQIKEAVRTHFYPLDCTMHAYKGDINPTDVLFATHWSTVEAAMKAREAAGEIMYFVQDFEPGPRPHGHGVRPRRKHIQVRSVSHYLGTVVRGCTEKELCL